MLNTLLPLVLTAALSGPGGPKGEKAKTYEGTAGELEIATPSIANARIDIDGRLDEAVWQQAALLTSFTQFEPVEGAPASQRTEVRVIIDDDAIYFAIKAYDDNPEGIRATLAERDSYTRSDDYVRILLDTFDDQRRAYVFTVNPLGVQHDGLWNETGGSTGRRGGFGSPIDNNPDFLWDSDAKILDWGYQVEIRIPFKSLRFREVEEQAWGLQVTRKIQRSGFESAWAPVSRNAANRLTQSGKLTGLKGLDMGLFMELNPVLTGKRIGQFDSELGRLRRDNPTGDFGLNATYGLTSNLTLDATYNPDFSQVEADAGQISVNERFALFFPEKRPFFLEGTEIFGMARQLVHTRTVANPVGGAKLTGKVGSFNIGYLGAIDESFDSGDPNTYVNLFRLRKDIGPASNIGAVYTDRTVDGNDYNRVAGADARLVFARRYTLTVMGAASLTASPSLESRSDGQMLYAKFERSGRAFSFNAELEDTDAAFDAGSGFFRRIGDTQFNSRISYNWFGKRGSLLEQVGPSFEFRGYWDHDAFWSAGPLEESQAQLGWRFSFRDNITFWGNYQRSMFQSAPGDYDGLFVSQPDGSYPDFRPDQDLFDGLQSTTFALWVNKWERVRGNIRYTISETPIFDRSFGVPVAAANSYSANATLNLYPTRSLVAEIGLRQTRLVRKSDGVEHSTALIPRIRAQYQFTRALFVRGIFEYSNQESLDLMDPVTGLGLYREGSDGEFSARSGSTRNDFRVEGLVSYEPSPGTVFFIGYTRQMQDSQAFRFRNLRSTADGLFVKLSYRFRM
jgi:Domain of unknown function (DUF5916)/Carbohydrate family 9 binding domain-like